MYLCVCMHTGARVEKRMQKSLDNLKQVLSLHRVHPGDQAQVVKTLPDELSRYTQGLFVDYAKSS